MLLQNPGLSFDEVAQKGRAIYDEQLKLRLEPSHNGESIAVHVDSGDYEVAESWYAARRLIRQRHPAGMIASFTIGPGTEGDFALANRIAAGQKP